MPKEIHPSPAILLMAALSLLSSCHSRRSLEEPPLVRVPLCEAPLCAFPCACDLTSICDPDCDACDPECGACRAPDGPCRMTAADAGTGADGGQPDVGTTTTLDCKDDQPPSQGASDPCCPEWGPDACGANLFCAAFDGRSQPTCYPERSRADRTECTADNQCTSGSCNTAVSRCRSSPTTTCDGEIGCAASPSGQPYVCDPASGACGAAGRDPGQLCDGNDGCDSGRCTASMRCGVPDSLSYDGSWWLTLSWSNDCNRFGLPENDTLQLSGTTTAQAQGRLQQAIFPLRDLVLTGTLDRDTYPPRLVLTGEGGWTSECGNDRLTVRLEAAFEREDQWSEGTVQASYRSSSCSPCDPVATVTGWKIR